MEITRSEMEFSILQEIDGVYLCIKTESIENAKNDGHWLPLDKLYLIPVEEKV